MIITVTLIVLNIIIFLWFRTPSQTQHLSVFDQDPEIDLSSVCGKSICSIVKGTFIHADTGHIMSNIFALLTLVEIEQIYGSAFYLRLIIEIFTMDVILEYILKRIFNTPCSIGFSGVITGIYTWLYTRDKSFHPRRILGLAVNIVVPSIGNAKSSIVGHTAGAISGLIVSKFIKI